MIQIPVFRHLGYCTAYTVLTWEYSLSGFSIKLLSTVVKKRIFSYESNTAVRNVRRDSR